MNVSFDVPPPHIVTSLMEKAELTPEEAWRVVLVEVARWNYRIHVIAHYDELSPSEQRIFDQAVRVRMSSSLSRWMYQHHFRDDANVDVQRYLARVLD